MKKKATSTDNTDNNDDTQIETPTEGEDDTGDGEETEDPIDDTPIEDPIDDNGSEEVIEPKYTVLAPDGSVFASNMPYSDFDYYKTILTKDVDYVEIDEYTCKLTEAGYAKVTNNTPVTDNPSDDDTEETTTPNPTETPSDTYKVFHINDNGNYVLDPTNVTNKTYKKGDTVTLPIKTPDYKTPTGLYLVKTYVTDADNNAVAVTYKDHTVSFTMPDSNVTVMADFYDVVFKGRSKGDTGKYPFTVDTNEDTCTWDFDVGLCFNKKVFDNLEYIDDKYVFRVANKSKITEIEESDDSGNKFWWYDFEITTTSTTESYKFCAIVVDNKKVFEPKDNKPKQIDLKAN